MYTPMIPLRHGADPCVPEGEPGGFPETDRDCAQGDPFDGVRALYTEMLRAQLEHGNNGMVKTKFLVLTIEAADIRTARARFSRIILDGWATSRSWAALAKALDGREWLAVLHGVLHPDGERFSFEWDWLAPSGSM